MAAAATGYVFQVEEETASISQAGSRNASNQTQAYQNTMNFQIIAPDADTLDLLHSMQNSKVYAVVQGNDSSEAPKVYGLGSTGMRLNVSSESGTAFDDFNGCKITMEGRDTSLYKGMFLSSLNTQLGVSLT
jgi:hypothetical protein